MDSQRQEKLMEENASLKKQLADQSTELEHRTRQIEIEAALENVRLRAGAMRSSSELGGASAVLFQQLNELGINAIRTAVGIFDDHVDVGNPKIKGDATYDDKTQTYNLAGGGYNIWFNRDEFQYVYNKIKGDFTVTAHFEFVGDKGNGHRKIGWMMRETADEDAVHSSAVVHGDGLIEYIKFIFNHGKLKRW